MMPRKVWIKKKRKTALLKMLTLTHSLMLMTNKEERFPCSGGADGISQTVSIHPSLLFLAMSLFSCITWGMRHGMTLEDAITFINTRRSCPRQQLPCGTFIRKTRPGSRGWICESTCKVARSIGWEWLVLAYPMQVQLSDASIDLWWVDTLALHKLRFLYNRHQPVT